jgi:NAD+ synthase (glutamine-hydrolysing)
MAVDAIGNKNIYGIMMPSKYSSTHSISDAKHLAKNLSINLLNKQIKNIFNIYKSELKMNEIALENIQARIRANIIMAHSNTYNSLALATGNKSELAVGYSTIYGDAIGGYAPLKDIYKTDIWKLAKWRNKKSYVIPKNSIEKEPSAELKFGQKDSDSLPNYHLLDKILFAYIEENQSLEHINKELLKFNNKNQSLKQPYNQVDKNLSFKQIIISVMDKVDASEWKRRQYPLGPKISSLAFGRDRRLPIVNKFIN